MPNMAEWLERHAGDVPGMEHALIQCLEADDSPNFMGDCLKALVQLNRERAFEFLYEEPRKVYPSARKHTLSIAWGNRTLRPQGENLESCPSRRTRYKRGGVETG